MKKTKRLRPKVGALILAGLAVVFMFPHAANAYDFQRSGAAAEGMLTITESPGAASVNGYYTLGGYDVTYTVTCDYSTPFAGCGSADFYMGSGVDVTGGCSLAYAPEGNLYESGALLLGTIQNGTKLGSVTRPYGNTLSYTHHFGSLSEMAAYIAVDTPPAGGAYRHISEEKGNGNHIWSYHDLAGQGITKNSLVDTEGPEVAAAVRATGTTVVSGGRTWGSQASLSVTVSDGKSRPGVVTLIKGGVPVATKNNDANGTGFTAEFPLTDNGVYTLEATDKLGNKTTRSVTVDCIDKTAPTVSSLSPSTTAYTRSLTLTARASDAQSGLHAQPYSWNGAGYTAENLRQITENGSCTLKVRDGLGNTATTTYNVTNIDREGPVIASLLPSATDYARSVSLTVAASDAKAGLSGTPYCWNGGAASGDATFCSEKNGTVTVKVSDRLGNESSAAYEIKNIDREGPVITGISRSTAGFARELTLTVAATDAKAGLAAEAYSWKDGAFQTSQDYTVSENGIYRVTVYDRLGNASYFETEVDNIDRTPPEIERLDKERKADGTVEVTVILKPDEGAPLPEQPYSFDGGKTWQESPTYRVDENGELQIRVRDSLDNTASEAVTITEVQKKGDDGSTNGADAVDGSGNNGDHENNGTGSGNDGNNENNKNNENNENNGTGNGDPGGSGNDENNNSGSGENGKTGDNSGAAPAGTGNAGANVNAGGIPVKIPQPFAGGKKNTGDRTKKTEKPVETKEPAQEDTSKEETLNLPPRFVEDTVTVEEVESKLKEKLSQKNETGGKEAIRNEKRRKKEKTVLAMLLLLLTAALLGGCLYLLLMYRRQTCRLYALSERRKREYLGRLKIKNGEETWSVAVPPDKLGNQGTGNYLLLFHPSFAAEEEGEDLLIAIDGKTLREKVKEEVAFSV